MDVSTAHKVLIESGQLIEHITVFQARYGKSYVLKPGSPEDAWSTYNDILDTQCRIARLLDEKPVEQPHRRCGQWWKHSDVMDIGIAQELVLDASHLIACCAHQTTLEPKMDWSYSINNSQAAIAGILHPASLQIGSDSSVQLNVS